MQQLTASTGQGTLTAVPAGRKAEEEEETGWLGMVEEFSCSFYPKIHLSLSHLHGEVPFQLSVGSRC